MKQFHSFRLDVLNHCLWNGEHRVPLTPKAFDVLRYLVEHADRLVTQDEILGALWPETHVNPEVIKKYVLGIRKALGDRHEKSEFIETFPRRGYQFVAPVTEENFAASSDAVVHAAQKIVGREASMVQLDGYLTQALKGQRQIIFITGEAGVGKTTLVDEFHQIASRHASLRVIRGQCVEGFGGKEAYYPVLEALGQWVRDASGGAVVHTLAKQAPTWLIQFPSLIKSEQREALQKEILGATRERMVREICEALESLTTHDPLVLVLEDLHWVDTSTLDFISALSRRRGPAKLLLLGTYRPADVIISQSPLRALKQDLVLHNLSHEIVLERLEESDVAEYLGIKFVGGDFPAAFANLIYRHSGGNALFMVTILQDMVKRELIAQANGIWTLKMDPEDADLSVPETLDQLIEMQFQQLSSVEKRLLRSASVAGERFSVWAITTAAETDTTSIEDACESLAERLQFIKAAGIQELANGQISAHYDFRHSLYREVLYRRLSDAIRSKLHLLLAQRLKAFGDPCEQELATELALHFEGGRDYAQAVRYLMLASENAAGRFAYREAIEILHHALELVGKVSPPLQAELEVEVLGFIGDAHFALGAVAESRQAHAAAASRANQAGLKTAHVLSLTCAMWPSGFVNPDQGLAGMDLAVEISVSVGNPLLLARTQMLAAGCRLVFDTWRQKDADLCSSAYETLCRLGDLYPSPYQQMIYGHILTLQGNYREALEIFEAGISPANHSVSLIAHYGAFCGKSLALLRQGRLGEALQITRAERKLAEQNLATCWLLSFREVWLRTLAFDFKGAQAICETIAAASADYPAGQPQTIGQIAAGYMALDREEYDQAIEHFRQVRDPDVTAKFFLHWVWRMTAQLESSNALLLSGNILKARTTADRFLESALSTADPHMHALAWELKARIAISDGDLNDARKCIERALAVVDKFEILVAAWQVYATAWHLHWHAKEHKIAELNRERAETCILKIANSFAPDESLRATFLAAAPVHRILREKVVNKATRQQRLRLGAAS
jgi:DNA-binding winged helix-turn-helix (wHTH) protein/tetratricopeptide (TPR) repeat protein